MNESGGRSGGSRLALAVAVTTTLGLAAVACGSDDAGSAAEDGAASTAAPTAPTAVPGNGNGGDAVNGQQLARSQGCAGCHGSDFGGGAGPSLVGLAGSEVLLADGTTVVADTDYLTRAIANPSADLVADYNLRMPANGLSDAEIADIVAFIETLADG